MKKLLAVFLICLGTCFAAAQTSVRVRPSPSPAEQGIERANNIIASKPNDYEAYNALALALSRRARETSDPAFYTKAEQALEKSFAISPGNYDGARIQVWLLLGKHEFGAALDEATKRSRGEIGYPEPGTVAVGKLRGAPVRERLMNYCPAEDADKAPTCAMLFLIAEKEELFDNRDHGIKAYERAKGPKKLVTLPNITHYGVYREAREQTVRLAVEWFDVYLKGDRPPEPAKK